MRKADNLPPFCTVVKKSRSLKFLDPSGPPLACNGSALPFICKLHVLILYSVVLIVFPEDCDLLLEHEEFIYMHDFLFYVKWVCLLVHMGEYRHTARNE